MKRIRKGAIVLLVSVFGVFGSATAHADGVSPISAENRQVITSYDNNSGPYAWDPFPRIFDAMTSGQVFGMNFNGGIDFKGFGAMIGSHTTTQPLKTYICDSTFVSCLNHDDIGWVTADGLMPLCSASHAAPCIEGLEYRVKGGSWQEATVAEQVDLTPHAEQLARSNVGPLTAVVNQTKIGWPAGLGYDLPASASGPIIFTASGLKNKGGTDTYALTPSYFFDSSPDEFKKNTGHVSDFLMNLRPVVIDPTVKTGFVNGEVDVPGYHGITSWGLQAQDGIVYSSPQETGWAAGFSEGSEFKLSFRMPATLGGWYQGRLSNPDIAQSSIDEKTNRIVLSAAPAEIPTIVAVRSYQDLVSSGSIKTLENSWYADGIPAAKAAAAENRKYIFANTWNPYLGVDFLTALAGDQKSATGVSTVWTVRSLFSPTPCMDGTRGAQGLLATNATVYNAGLPQFTNNELSYQVGGAHYKANGDLFQGEYYFIMKDEVAKCVYGFTGKAPISGTVSVTSTDGNEQVAYTNVTDRGGWLKLTAQGFTFSNPKITAKLVQEPEPTPVVTPSPTASPTAAPEPNPTLAPTPSASLPTNGSWKPDPPKKTTITCVKGKLIKKVTAFNPKCPAGYKIKLTGKANA